MPELTWWISPFTQLGSLAEAIGAVQANTPDGWHGNLLLPTHFGRWPQAQCRQSLPAEMRVGSPSDVPGIRATVEASGLGFGAWGVPVDQAGASVASGFAAESGYYAANFEPEAFWLPGDDPAAIDAWWGEFWNGLPDQGALNGSVAATVIPNDWGLGAFANSLPNLAAGSNALLLECYGGPSTAAEYPSLWPVDGLIRVAQLGAQKLAAILARDNLAAQLAAFKDNVHVWYL